jgi:hypothetical protein
VRFAICILGAEIFAVEFTNNAEEEYDGEGKLTTSDHSFGFGGDPLEREWYEEEE